MAKTMNQAVETRLGNLTATICEYEVITSQLQARVQELEAELERLTSETGSQAEARARKTKNAKQSART